MLVQASDKLEDVIDMSADNLKRLKEESRLADMDRIIRYIRIFSELSGQIRYSAIADTTTGVMRLFSR